MQFNVPIKALRGLFGKPEEECVTVEKVSPLKKMMNSPEDYKLEAYFEGDALMIRVAPKPQPQVRLDPQKLIESRKMQDL